MMYTKDMHKWIYLFIHNNYKGNSTQGLEGYIQKQFYVLLSLYSCSVWMMLCCLWMKIRVSAMIFCAIAMKHNSLN